ncbi:MAG: HdeD family acid-resistance protein [Synechococcaceae cyanobacterium]
MPAPDPLPAHAAILTVWATTQAAPMPSGATFNDPDASSLPTAPLDRRALQLEKLRGLTQTEGILLIVLGVLALAFPVIASAGVTLMVALAFLIGGILGWVDNLRRARAVSRLHTFGRLVVATLFLITGLWILIQFKAGLVPAAQQIKALATALGIVFLAEGVVASGLALSHRQVRGWRWGLANGLITVLLGLLILTMSPAGLLSVLGLLVGISFLFSGFDLLRFGSQLHPRRSGEEA